MIALVTGVVLTVVWIKFLQYTKPPEAIEARTTKPRIQQHSCLFPVPEPNRDWAWRCEYCGILWLGTKRHVKWIKADPLTNLWAKISGV